MPTKHKRFQLYKPDKIPHNTVLLLAQIIGVGIFKYDSIKVDKHL